MSKKDPERMVREEIEQNLDRVSAFYGVSFNANFKEDGEVVTRNLGPKRFPRLKEKAKSA